VFGLLLPGPTVSIRMEKKLLAGEFGDNYRRRFSPGDNPGRGV